MIGQSRGVWWVQEWALSHPHWFGDDNGTIGGIIGLVGYDGKYGGSEYGRSQCLDWTTRLLKDALVRKHLVFSTFDEVCQKS